jgi:hypothetical protein
MPGNEKSHGELWNGDDFLCEVDVNVSDVLTCISAVNAQHVALIPHDIDIRRLRNIPGFTLILADGRRYVLPALTLLVAAAAYLECFLNDGLL